MTKKNGPKQVQDFDYIWIYVTENLSVLISEYANGCPVLKIVTGKTPDISEYIEFSFYDWFTFKQDTGIGEFIVGRWLGVSHKVGQLVLYWILPISG